jgi:hypothetical protein
MSRNPSFPSDSDTDQHSSFRSPDPAYCSFLGRPELTESISATKDSNKTTSQLLSSTCALPTDAQLAALLPQSQSAAAVAKEHLATLQSGQKELITPEQMKMLVAEIEKVAVLGRKRRGACLDMMDMVCEMANLKKAELVENAGLTL